MQSDTADFATGIAAWRTVQNTRRFDCGLFSPLYENMPSSTKPKVHNVLHFRRRRSSHVHR